jgi:hypothetical protein
LPGFFEAMVRLYVDHPARRGIGCSGSAKKFRRKSTGFGRRTADSKRSRKPKETRVYPARSP